MSSSSKSDRFDYQLRIQVAMEDSDAALLAFLKAGKYKVYNHKEMVLAALRAYWLPIALEATIDQDNSITDEQLARIAFQAYLNLRERADTLYQRFCSRLSREQQKELEQSLRADQQNSSNPDSLSQSLPSPNLLSDQDYFQQRQRRNQNQFRPR